MLLGTPLFDTFLLEECTITAANTFTIDGHINKAFYTAEELAAQNLTAETSISPYAALRPVCFDLIKGKKTPLGFRFVFHLSRENTGKLLTQTNASFALEEVNALVLNIRYDGTVVTCTTGTSLSVFTMDKSLEHAWDEMIRRFLLKNEIAFSE